MGGEPFALEPRKCGYATVERHKGVLRLLEQGCQNPRVIDGFLKYRGATLGVMKGSSSGKGNLDLARTDIDDIGVALALFGRRGNAVV